MKVEQAIKLLNPDTMAGEIAEIEYKYGFGGKEAAAHKINKACKIACKAMEKQIPKKVTHEATLYRCCTCPTCKNVIDKFEKWGESTIRVKYKYCYFCGQALDWNDNTIYNINHNSLCETETLKVGDME